MNATKTKTYHASAADVRRCFEGQSVQATEGGIRCGNSHAEPVSTWPRSVHSVSAPPANPWAQDPRPTNLDEAREASLTRRTTRANSPVWPASDKQIKFVRDLADEVLVEAARKALEAHLGEMTSAQAKVLIDDMLVMRTAKRQRDTEYPATATAQPSPSQATGWRSLISQVMGEREERNFAIIDEDGKARFYRVSKRGKQSRRPGTWKIQERVSDSLFPRADALMNKVFTAIIAQGGAEAAGRRFGELMHRCYECGASLTDTTGNPYYAMGLGPECGAK